MIYNRGRWSPWALNSRYFAVIQFISTNHIRNLSVPPVRVWWLLKHEIVQRFEHSHVLSWKTNYPSFVFFFFWIFGVYLSWTHRELKTLKKCWTRVNVQVSPTPSTSFYFYIHYITNQVTLIWPSGVKMWVFSSNRLTKGTKKKIYEIHFRGGWAHVFDIDAFKK